MAEGRKFCVVTNINGLEPQDIERLAKALEAAVHGRFGPDNPKESFLDYLVKDTCTHDFYIFLRGTEAPQKGSDVVDRFGGFCSFKYRTNNLAIICSSEPGWGRLMWEYVRHDRDLLHCYISADPYAVLFWVRMGFQFWENQGGRLKRSTPDVVKTLRQYSRQDVGEWLGEPKNAPAKVRRKILKLRDQYFDSYFFSMYYCAPTEKPFRVFEDENYHVPKTKEAPVFLWVCSVCGAEPAEKMYTCRSSKKWFCRKNCFRNKKK
jgi:hypothetical protein